MITILCFAASTESILIVVLPVPLPFAFKSNPNTKYLNGSLVFFEEAKLFIRTHNINSKKEWFEFYELNKGDLKLPKTLHFFYKSEWKGWADFLGKE